MFVVAVEKVDDGLSQPDPIIIIRSNWLTPRKQECYWPPYKNGAKFNVALSKAEEPDENWNLINIKKRLYETDDLQKARKKAKEAEIESDLVTDEAEVPSNDIRRSKRKKRRIISVETESEYSEDDQVDNGSSFAEVLHSHIPSPPSCSLFSGVQVHGGAVPLSQPSCSGNIKSPTRQYHQSQAIHTNTPKDTVGNGPTQLETRKYSEFEVLLRKIENLKETCDENNKLLHALLVEKIIRAEDSPMNDDCPVSLPCESLQDVEAVEEFLKDPENRKNFVTNLGIIGGLNAEKHVRRILCALFTNELAQKYNWMGKGDKRALKDTIIPTVIIDAVKRNKKNFAGTTIFELQNTIKQWFRFAKDRSGGREKRRSLNHKP